MPLDPGGRHTPSVGGAGSGVDLDDPGHGRVNRALGGVVGQRWGSAAPCRAERTVVAPVTETAGAGTPVTSRRGSLDRLPERLDLALGAQQVLLVGLVGDDLTVAEIDQLQALG